MAHTLHWDNFITQWSNWDVWHGNLPISSMDEVWRRVILALQESWRLAWVSDLEHWIWWLHSFLALLTEIKIISDGTLVPYSLNRISIASITNHLGVNNFGLLFSLLLEVSCQHFLILLSAVRLDLVVKDFLKIFEELIVDLTCSIAFLARKPVFVNHFTITLEAFWEVL